LLLSAPPQNLFLVILLTTVITLLVVSCWGISTAYINERFQTGIRASAFEPRPSASATASRWSSRPCTPIIRRGWPPSCLSSTRC
jgi:hypothetical protein